MRALDLFCCSGGASTGLALAGFEVGGADIAPHPDYAFPCDQADLSVPGAIDAMIAKHRPDFVWASPPCQAYSVSTKIAKRQNGSHPDLVAPTREALTRSEVPAVMENVPGAPFHHALILCGSMFGLKVKRHRLFELFGWWTFEPPHVGCQGRDIVTVSGEGGCRSTKPGGWRRNTPGTDRINWRNALDYHGTKDRWALSQAIPPAYAKWIGEAFLGGIRDRQGGKT